ncbi:ornithine cyclodeaminase family protein [Streptomyces tricolor]|nr:ornithine cyclodeaminase family protein [Streptomyces tricolor]
MLEPAACLAALRDGFRTADAVTVPGRRVRTDLPSPGTATALIPGLLPGVDAYTVKVNAKFPGARPALRGVIWPAPGADGELLALLDSATVTAWRTGLAAALGTGLLAPADYDVLGVIGAGAQAESTLRGLTSERRPRDLVVHDTYLGRAAVFAARHGGRVLGPPGRWPTRPTSSCSRPGPGPRCSPSPTPAPGSTSPASAPTNPAAGTRRRPAGRGPPRRRRPGNWPPGPACRRRPDCPGRPPTPPSPTSARHPPRPDLAPSAHGVRPRRTALADLALAWSAFRAAERRGIGTTVDLLG